MFFLVRRDCNPFIAHKAYVCDRSACLGCKHSDGMWNLSRPKSMIQEGFETAFWQLA